VDISNIVEISGGDQYSLILDNFGKVYSFGNNLVGQLGIGENISNSFIPIQIPSLSDIVQIGAIGYSSFVLNKFGLVSSFGLNYVFKFIN
jgi:alpha-tubulin suppressor-like RCC1 family protein